MAVECWSEEGQKLQGDSGELVCVKPFPSMPVAFWNDPKGEKYHKAYFEKYPGTFLSIKRKPSHAFLPRRYLESFRFLFN